MRDLLHHPLWLPEDLGQPIPDTVHAVSVCLPTWRDNVGYEEGEARVREALRAGYPRFVYHPLVRALFEACEQRFAGPDEAALAWPSATVGRRFQAWLSQRTGAAVRLHPGWTPDFVATVFPRAVAAEAKAYWQHGGEGISSRRAEAILGQSADPGASASEGQEARATLRRQLAAAYGIPAGDIWLFPIGMTALFVAHRALRRLWPERPTVQFGFPYVDTLKVQQKFGAGVRFLPHASASDLTELHAIAAGQPLAGIFTEFPSNPLLISPDLGRLAAITRRLGVPLVVDDTLATPCNADLRPVADIICSSLTKSFSGVGDVTGGVLVINPASPLAETLRAAVAAEYEDLLWDADAVVLARNGAGFAERVRVCSTNATALAAWLAAQPKVARVYHPSLTTPELYRAWRRPEGGDGAMFSLLLHEPATRAPRFFDALRCCKGPNLGMEYTLVCPFTILAHYDELDWAESVGVSRWLLRVAVGREPLTELVARFAAALDHA